MSKKRRRNRRQSKQPHTSLSGKGRAFPGSPRRHSPQGSALSAGSRVIPMTFVFHGPEVAVETFRLDLAGGSSQVLQTPVSASPTLVKGCPRQYAIEDCDAIRLCTPSYYREDGSSLIWDEREGAVASLPRTSERRDDPSDFPFFSQIDAEPALTGQLGQAVNAISSTNWKVTERVQSSLTYGDNCLLWCTSVRPRTAGEWSKWRESLETSYDHVTVIRDPHQFAQALGAMALEQKGLRGSGSTFRHPLTGEVAHCASLPVVYGPVIYTDRRREYIEESSSELEFVLRGLFTKTTEHRHQREYRFVLLTKSALQQDTLALQVSDELITALKHKGGPPNATEKGPEVWFKDCFPSPRVFRCLSAVAPTQRQRDGVGPVLEARVQSIFHLAGVDHEHRTKIRRTVQTLEDVDHQILEHSIAEERGSPSDARIIKFTLDGGPGSIFSVYDFGGLAGTYRIAAQSGEAVVTAVFPESVVSSRQVLIDNSQFDGSSFLNSPPRQLKLSYTTANPLTKIELKPSDPRGTRVTITATSEDGTAESSFEIAFGAGLGISAQRINQIEAS